MRSTFSILVLVGAVAIAYSALVGAEQLPERPVLGAFVSWLVAGGVLFVARTESLRADSSAPGRVSGVLFVLFGPFYVASYLFSTRRQRHWGLSGILASVAFSPFVGYVLGVGATLAWPIPPRYVDFGDARGPQRVTAQVATATARADFARIARFLADEAAAQRPLPHDGEELYVRWGKARPEERIPLDLFTGVAYYYESRDTGYGLWSAGPDRTFDTADDLWFLWPEGSPEP